MFRPREKLGIPKDVFNLVEAAELSGYDSSQLRRICQDPDSGVDCWKGGRDIFIKYPTLVKYAKEHGHGPKGKRAKVRKS